MHELCAVLIRLAAPILSFTSEEAWQELRKKDASLPESVFLSEFPKADDKFVFAGELKEKWAKMMEIRNTALTSFEELRRNKEIGSNLEAGITVGFEEKDRRAVENIELLKNVLGTWDVKTVAKEKAGVEVKKSELKKCERCWRHIEEVSAEGICPRCAKAL